MKYCKENLLSSFIFCIPFICICVYLILMHVSFSICIYVLLLIGSQKMHNLWTNTSKTSQLYFLSILVLLMIFMFLYYFSSLTLKKRRLHIYNVLILLIKMISFLNLVLNLKKIAIKRNCKFLCTPPPPKQERRLSGKNCLQFLFMNLEDYIFKGRLE